MKEFLATVGIVAVLLLITKIPDVYATVALAYTLGVLVGVYLVDD